MFDSKDDAQAAFSKLSKMYDSLSKSKKTFKLKEKSVAEFSYEAIFDEINSVQFILTNDELYDNRYNLVSEWAVLPIQTSLNYYHYCLQSVSAMLQILFKTIFWGSIIFLIIFLWTITIGQAIHYEFRDLHIRNVFYNVILGGTPIAILLTLFGTLKKRQENLRQLLIIVGSIGLAVFAFIFLLNNLFTIGFGAWRTFNIAYKHNTYADRQIREQMYDIGALGFGRSRVVEVAPFALFFWDVSNVDTTKIDKTKWNRIDQQGDAVLP